jgi:hypothetical protein
MDDHDRAMRIVHKAGADRTEHDPAKRAFALASHDHHVRILGLIDERGNGRAMYHHAVHERRAMVGGAVGERPARVFENSPRFVVLPLKIVLRYGNLWPRRSRRRDRCDDVHEC